MGLFLLDEHPPHPTRETGSISITPYEMRGTAHAEANNHGVVESYGLDQSK